MNRGWADAWDELEQMALRLCPNYSEVRLVRDGHRMYYQWSQTGVDVQVWATEDEPRFGGRVALDEDWRAGLRFLAWDTSALVDLLKLSIPWMAAAQR